MTTILRLHRGESEISGVHIGRTSRSRAVHIGGFLAAVALVCAGCNKEGGGPSAAELTQCRTDAEKLQETITSLKKKLAEALANPGTIKMDRVDIAGDAPKTDNAPAVKEGNLSQKAVVTTVSNGKGALQACYNRALKRNTTLHHQAITVNLAFSVQPNGSPKAISVRPSYDSQMSTCMRGAIKRWKFPPFSGQPVGVEMPVRLTPSK